MAKISTYPGPSSPSLSDMLIGTDVNDMLMTKNFTIGDIISVPGSSTYVPYTGATTQLNLGPHDLIAANIVRAGIQNYECDFSFNDLIEKYKLNPMRIVETLYQAADIKIGKEDGLTLSDKLQIIKNG